MDWRRRLAFPPAVAGLVVAGLLLAACGRGTPTAATSPAPTPSASPSLSGPPEPTPSLAPSPLPSPGRNSASPGSPVVSTHLPAPSPSPSPPAASRAPSVITQADNGRTFTLPVGGSAQLQLASLTWSTPAVEGNAVQVTPVTFIRDPGYQAWTISGVTPGVATLRSNGQPECPPAQACPMFIALFTVTIEVVG